MDSSKKAPARSVLIVARLLTILVSLTGAEAMLWFAGYPPWWGMSANTGGAAAEYECDPDLGWRLRQGSFDLVWPDRPNGAHYTNWSGGRRATAVADTAEDASNRPRVLFFGDSYVQGYELSDQSTLPWIVQQHHPELRVSNFAAGNYSTYQAYLAMKKWVHGSASVYYLFSTFLEARNAAAPSWLRIFKKPPPGCFYPYAELSGGELQPRRSDGDVVWPLSRRIRLVAMVEEYTEIAESYLRVRNQRKLTETLLAKMNEAVGTEGGQFTVILFDLAPAERNEYREFLSSEKIRFIDCDRPEMKDKKLRLADGHPDQGLNELVARWIEPLNVVAGQTVARKN